MYADIEALVLSGELLNGTSRSSSPSRSEPDDHDPGWHDEYIAGRHKHFNEKGLDYDSDSESRDAAKGKERQDIQSIGMGPGRTGVKGVIRDRNEAAQIQRQKKVKEIEELRKKMDSANLGGMTFLEEEREKAAMGEKADELVIRDLEKMRDKLGLFGIKRPGKFGHLREIGLKGFLAAVEKEDKGVWVIVHLYDASLDRCYLIDEKLARLAREFPDVKFLRARAAALGFASLNTSKPKPAFIRMKPHKEDDEDDPYSDGEKDAEYGEAEDFCDDQVDLDMLPTMLVYRNGELVYNWVRVDWEAGDAGLQELLVKHHVLPHSWASLEFRVPDESELEFDLGFSDDEDI